MTPPGAVRAVPPFFWLTRAGDRATSRIHYAPMVFSGCEELPPMLWVGTMSIRSSEADPKGNKQSETKR
jgi:hypothetical protein